MPDTHLKIFISSVQKELAEDRRAVKSFVTHDPLLSRFASDVFLFEDIPAKDRRPDDIYLGGVELVRRAGRHVTRRRFPDMPGLIREIYASLVECLENRGALRTTPFDDSECDGATLRDIDKTEVKTFVETAEAAGRLIDVIDQAVAFVLIKIDRSVGTRATSTQVSVTFEIPRAVITEAIVNAVTHRNYHHNGFVQVIVFADRVGVWNPGELPPGLTPDLLRKPHGPIPRNPLIAEPLFRIKYVEKAGTGTTDMIAHCRKAELPEPDFEQRGPHFVVTLWRDWLTEKAIDELNFNNRQKNAIAVFRQERRVTNTKYQEITGASRATAKRDLLELVQKGLLIPTGAGRGAHYQVPKKRLINGSSERETKNGSCRLRIGEIADRSGDTENWLLRWNKTRTDNIGLNDAT